MRFPDGDVPSSIGYILEWMKKYGPLIERAFSNGRLRQDSTGTGVVGPPQAHEVPWGPLGLVLMKPLPGATNNATLDDDWVYNSPWTNEAVRINNWRIRFESNLAANATFELRKNGTAIAGSSITVTAGTRTAAIDAFTETTLAQDDSLEVWQTVGGAENIGGSARVYGDQDVLASVSYV